MGKKLLMAIIGVIGVVILFHAFTTPGEQIDQAMVGGALIGIVIGDHFWPFGGHR